MGSYACRTDLQALLQSVIVSPITCPMSYALLRITTSGYVHRVAQNDHFARPRSFLNLTRGGDDDGAGMYQPRASRSTPPNPR